MELTVKIRYNQILKLIYQLPKKDIEKLAKTLQEDLNSEKSTNTIQDLILQAPNWSELELADFQEARTSINKSRIA